METQNFFIRIDKNKNKKCSNPNQYDSYELGWVQFENIKLGF